MVGMVTLPGGNKRPILKLDKTQKLRWLGWYQVGTKDKGQILIRTQKLEVHVDTDFAGNWDPSKLRIEIQLDQIWLHHRICCGPILMEVPTAKVRWHYHQLNQSILLDSLCSLCNTIMSMN